MSGFERDDASINEKVLFETESVEWINACGKSSSGGADDDGAVEVERSFDNLENGGRDGALDLSASAAWKDEGFGKWCGSGS